jgi:ADP-ribosyl-[dinitrogen reductase] hydrolase
MDFLTNHIQDRFRGCLLGLAAGDALGTTVEFQRRGSFPAVTDIVGGGVFGLVPGQWTDDTSMALCLAASLVETGDFDMADQMNRYLRWYDHGYMSSTGKCFDIGNTTRYALERYRQSGKAASGSSHPSTVGNGSLMRLAPVPMFFYPDRARARVYAGKSSRTTHAAKLCVEACILFADMLVQALAGKDKDEILFGSNSLAEIQSLEILGIANGGYKNKKTEHIRSNGYVVDSLEAALWCFWKTHSFEQAVLTAANLGEDADTTAAICGQLAGAFYGERNIPHHWLEKLHMRKEITTLADRLAIR